MVLLKPEKEFFETDIWKRIVSDGQIQLSKFICENEKEVCDVDEFKKRAKAFEHGMRYMLSLVNRADELELE